MPHAQSERKMVKNSITAFKNTFQDIQHLLHDFQNYAPKNYLINSELEGNENC